MRPWSNARLIAVNKRAGIPASILDGRQDILCPPRYHQAIFPHGYSAIMSNAITHPGAMAEPAKASRSPQRYWNPYLVGAFLGLMLLASYLVAGRGLGATGAFSSIAAWIASLISPEHAQANPVHARYLANGSPLTAWLVFLILGAFAGAALSGWLAGRTRLMVEKGPQLSNAARLAIAAGGGVIAGTGAKVAMGCTSGQALTGGAILNAGSLVFMGAVFAAGYAVAWIFRKEWL
jgi:uncharacterized membrane protein YedE/YeeE